MFADYLKKLGRSSYTVKSYGYWVRRAELYGLDLKTCSAGELESWISTIVVAPATLKILRGSLKAYWTYCHRRNGPVWVIRVPKQPRGECRALEPSEAALLALEAKLDAGRKGLATSMGLYQGLRRFEIAKVRWSDMGDWMSIVGKGNVQDRIPLHPEIVKFLGCYPKQSDWLFPSDYPHGPGHVSAHTIWAWIREIANRAGVEQVCPHRLRHTCLATANDNSHDLRTVQALARHARPEVTAIYTRATRERLTEVMDSIWY